MESKKKFASLMEDDAISMDQPLFTAGRPSSPSPSGRLSFRRSTHSTRSSAAEISSQLSCVARETSKEECSRHRFIVWAAVKRNSCQRMTESEKRECPLLRCTSRFPDHEAMLKHLVDCEHLSSCEYWCFDHSRVERFDDSKCKKCLGHPSKRRKMLTMAKTFFSSLGHKSRKGHGSEFDGYDSPLPPPPSYDEANPHVHVELSATEIVEIDSTELPVSLQPAPEASIDPQALLLPPELDSTAIPTDSFMQWQPSPMICTSSLAPHDGHLADRGAGLKPSLQLNTQGLEQFRQAPRPRPIIPPAARSKNLSPSSSVRSNASTMSNISSIISPISCWSHGSNTWSSGLETSLTSPTSDFVASGDFVSDNMFVDVTNDCNYNCPPEFPHDMFSELPAEVPATKVVLESLSSDPLLFPLESNLSSHVSYDPNVVLPEDVKDELDLDQVGIGEPIDCYSETKALVASTWDLLIAHINSSLSKTCNLGNTNSLAKQLQMLSPQSLSAIGFQALRGALNGCPPASAIESLCLVHLVYALSLVAYGQEAAVRCKSLFLQAVAYAQTVPVEDRQQYIQLAMTIWQPDNVSQAEMRQHLSASNGFWQRSSSQKGKAPEARIDKNDSIVCTARSFLDDLEVSAILGHSSSSFEVLASDLFTKHFQFNTEASPNGAFVVTINFILGVLVQSYPGADILAPKLKVIHQRLTQGAIRSVRRAELELLQAGKSSLTPADYFDKFAPEVRNLCDPLYTQHEAGDSQRSIFYGHCITLMESIIAEINADGTGMPGTVLEDPSLDDIFGLPDPFGDDAEALLHLPTDKTLVTEPATGMGTPDDGEGLRGETTSAGLPSSSTTVDDQQAGNKVEANDSCELCGYRPKGDPQWFKGSMAKHKKLQHSTNPPVIYKCPYPGCNSQYRNRQDNLRQHQIEKNHWVGKEAPTKKPRRQQQTQSANDEPNGENTSRRPSKRKKMSDA